MSYTYDPVAAQQSYLDRLPEDGRRRLQEPRDEDFLREELSGRLVCKLPAVDPVTTPAPFLELRASNALSLYGVMVDCDRETAANRNIWGGGLGFFGTDAQPRLRVAMPSPNELPQFFPFLHFYVVSPQVVALFRKYDSTAISTIGIDWRFSDGVRLDGYLFMDILAQRHSCDFVRSDLKLFRDDYGRRVSLVGHRTVRADIPSHVHVFRDSLESHSLFASRALAVDLEAVVGRAWHFLDTQQRTGPDLTLERIRRERAHFKRTHSAPYGGWDRVRAEALPLIRQGDFSAAEERLIATLRAIEPTPYHIVCDLNIRTQPKDVARHIEDYAKRARREHPLGSVYCEMNGFSINPDRWFFNAFGFVKDGGRDDLDWLGDFESDSDQDMTIEGLEPLQRVFHDSMLDREGGFEEGRACCSALVIVKFQRLMREARPLMKKLRVPLLASAHEYNEFTVEIPTR